MPEMNDYRSTLFANVHRIFGSKDKFNHWLECAERVGFAPADEVALGRQVLKLGGYPWLPLGTSPDGIMAGLKNVGIDWSRSVRQCFEKAELDWPEIAESHEAVLARIKKVWM